MMMMMMTENADNRQETIIRIPCPVLLQLCGVCGGVDSGTVKNNSFKNIERLEIKEKWLPTHLNR